MQRTQNDEKEPWPCVLYTSSSLTCKLHKHLKIYFPFDFNELDVGRLEHKYSLAGDVFIGVSNIFKGCLEYIYIYTGCIKQKWDWVLSL